MPEADLPANFYLKSHCNLCHAVADVQTCDRCGFFVCGKCSSWQIVEEADGPRELRLCVYCAIESHGQTKA